MIPLAMARTAVLALLLAPASARLGQPAGEFGTDAGDVGSGRPAAPGYRNAWDDCGGVGASATDRTRTMAAEIKGFAKQVEFTRHAAQDCGSLPPHGLAVGPGDRMVYPGPSVFKAATDGLLRAADALDKFGAKR